MSLYSRLRNKLRTQAAQPRKNLSLILIGFALTLLGIGLIMSGEYLFSQPLERELVALAGVTIVAAGCCCTAFGYLCLSLLRILFFLEDDDKPPKD
ncbi:MAG: hypothetical protein ACPG4U_16905 [Pseudomonadales bacterium]